MKKLVLILDLLVISLAGETLTAQTGWIQTGLNPNTGYSLYATDSELYAATYNGVYSTADSGMPWFSKGPASHSVYDVIKSHQYILAATELLINNGYSG